MFDKQKRQNDQTVVPPGGGTVEDNGHPDQSIWGESSLHQTRGAPQRRAERGSSRRAGPTGRLLAVGARQPGARLGSRPATSAGLRPGSRRRLVLVVSLW